MQHESLPLKYKGLFIRLFNLLIYPNKEWEAINKENKDFNEILSLFVLPIIFIVTLITFGNKLFTRNHLDYAIALKHSIAIFTALFTSYWATYKIIHYTINKRTYKTKGKTSHIAASIAGYSSISIYLFYLITSLNLYFPGFFIIQLHTFFLAWSGCKLISNFESKDDRIVVSLITGLLLTVLPYLILKLFTQLTINI